MGLSLKTRKEIQKEHFRRYQQARKKEKGKILDELEGATGQNRDYSFLGSHELWEKHLGYHRR